MLNSGRNKTVWGNPDTKLQSQWGFITYHEWCEKEAARMNANGGNCGVVYEDGLVCIQRTP